MIAKTIIKIVLLKLAIVVTSIICIFVYVLTREHHVATIVVRENVSGVKK